MRPVRLLSVVLGDALISDLGAYACERVPSCSDPAARDEHAPVKPRVSPDEKWEALVVNHDVHVRDLATDSIFPLSLDGPEDDAYPPHSLRWSPGSAACWRAARSRATAAGALR